jgi:hypothetical protein
LIPPGAGPTRAPRCPSTGHRAAPRCLATPPHAGCSCPSMAFLTVLPGFRGSRWSVTAPPLRTPHQYHRQSIQHRTPPFPFPRCVPSFRPDSGWARLLQLLLWPLLSSTPKPSLCPVPSLSPLPPPTLPHPVRLREPRLLGTPLLAACEPGPIPSSPSLPVLPWTLTIPPAPPPLSPRSSVSIRGCAGPPSPGPS